MHLQSPSHRFRGEIVGDYLPVGPPLALLARPVLVGSSDPLLAAPGGVELAVGLLTGLEPEATRLPTLTYDCVSPAVLVVRTLTLSLLS